MQLGRSLVTATAAVALALSLSACGAVDRIRGFDYATDRDYTPAAGTNYRSSTVSVLGAAVVSATEGSGTLVTSLVNKDLENEAQLVDVSGTYTDPDGNSTEVVAEPFEAVTIPPAGLVNLADAETPLLLTGDFEAGNFLVLTFTFADGETATFDVPVVSNFTGDWAGLDRSPGAEDAEAPPTVEVEVGHSSGH